jgi:hypothetical protein
MSPPIAEAEERAAGAQDQKSQNGVLGMELAG